MAAPIYTSKPRMVRSSKSYRIVLGTFLVIAALFAATSTWFLVNSNVVPSIFDIRDSVGLNFNDQDLPDPTRMDVVAHKPSIPLRMITFNIRYANSHPVTGERVWTQRGPKLLNEVNFITAGHENVFLCLQEALYPQVRDIQAGLGDSWSYVGHGRDNGKTNGEFSPIFYRADVWKAVRSETRWLSETPDRPSRDWGADQNRIVTLGEFKHRVTGTNVVVMSTHFDYQSFDARKNSAQLLLKFAAEWNQGGNHSAVLIGGDFNSTPDDVAYQLMTAPDSGMSDVAEMLPLEKHFGNRLTYTSFGEEDEWPQRIDFLFLQKPSTAVVKTFGVLPNMFDDQIRVSDHRPVVSDLDIQV